MNSDGDGETENRCVIGEGRDLSSFRRVVCLGLRRGPKGS